MTKRLKKRIREVCGLDSLSKEERAIRIQEILDSTDEKQAICNQIIGTSFKDIEKALISIKGKTSESDQLAEDIPEKVYPERQTLDREIRGTNVVELMDPKEVAWLVEQSTKPLDPIVSPEVSTDLSYESYSLEEVAALMECSYHPSMFKRKRGN